MLGNLGRMYAAGADIDWRKLFPADAVAVKLPPYVFQRETYWRESNEVRRVRFGDVDHPLLGHRREGPQPLWTASLDTADSGYLADHRIGNAIVFPGAGYVEMGIAAAREMFGPVSCVVEDVEFQKFLLIEEKGGRPVQVVVDTSASDFGVYARSDTPDGGWDLHARGYVRQSDRPAPAAVQIADIRRRCTEEVDRDEFFRLFAGMGIHYGPTFQGIEQIRRGDREALVEIQVPPDVEAKLADYRLHPAVLDACFQSVFAAVPPNSAKTEAYVPVKVERVRFHASPSTRLFAHARLKDFGPIEAKADIAILDESGNCLVEVIGFVCRPAGLATPSARGTIYEYQWKLQPRASAVGERDSRHVATPQALSAVMEKERDDLWRRFDRVRFQSEFRLLSRRTTAAYIVNALRQLGWKPAMATEPTDALADRLGMAPQYRRWLNLMMKELTPDEKASAVEPRLLWKQLWEEFPDCQSETTLLRLCGENLPAVLRGEIDPLNLLFPEGALTNLEHLYQDSPSMRLNNLATQKVLLEIVGRLPRGKMLRILEVGGGTGGTTSSLLPALPEHCTEYVFTDVTPMFMAHAQHRFARYPFVQFRTLDIERDPAEQGFEPHSFDVIIASDVLHATRDLRKTLDHVRQLLGSGGMLVLLEPTQPWLAATLIFGLLKGWWAFEDNDIRPDEPCVSADTWARLLTEAGFDPGICIPDCPDVTIAQHSVILARGAERPAPAPAQPAPEQERRTWLVFADANAAGRRERRGATRRRAAPARRPRDRRHPRRGIPRQRRGIRGARRRRRRHAAPDGSRPRALAASCGRLALLESRPRNLRHGVERRPHGCGADRVRRRDGHGPGASAHRRPDGRPGVFRDPRGSASGQQGRRARSRTVPVVGIRPGRHRRISQPALPPRRPGNQRR